MSVCLQKMLEFCKGECLTDIDLCYNIDLVAAALSLFDFWLQLGDSYFHLLRFALKHLFFMQ